MTDWLVPLVASAVALVVGLGFDAFQRTGRMRRKIEKDVAIAGDLTGEVKEELLAHVETQTRLLIAAEEPLRVSEQRLVSRGREVMMWGAVVLLVAVPQQLTDPKLWSDVASRFGSLVLVMGALVTNHGRRQQEARQQEKRRHALPESDRGPLREQYAWWPRRRSRRAREVPATRDD